MNSNLDKSKEENIIDRYLPEIHKCSLFHGESREELVTSLELMSYRFSSYSKNEYLLHSGTVFERFGLVVYGRVKVMLDDIEGNQTIMAEVIPGNTFGESLCLIKQNTDIYICAAEETGVIWLSTGKLFSDIGNEHIRKLEKRFTEMLAARTLTMNNRIQILSKLSLREKIITFLTFSKQNSEDKSIDVYLSREEMAIYIGTNRSALSRELSNMKKDGLIDYSGNHFVIRF